MVAMTQRIVAVADVSVGYGSPQITALTHALAARYDRQALILEPDQSDKRPMTSLPERCSVGRLITTVSPHTVTGRMEYVHQAARRINQLRPDVLVIFCTYSLPVLAKLHYRPRLTVYHSVESIVGYGGFDPLINRYLADQIDVVIFPEENRAVLDGARCGLLHRPLAIAYNVRQAGAGHVSETKDRAAKLLYSGTLHREQTFAEYFLRDELASFPIDIYGPLSGPGSDELRESLLRLSGQVSYRGYVQSDTLDAIRRRYAYSIVMWAPTNENQRFAAPNKFFDAIADGVPPIAAPHPQCEMLINRYHCGVLMEDWTFAAFHAAIKKAMAIFGTPRYDELVANCRRAVELELNWDAQFAKIQRLLPETL